MIRDRIVAGGIAGISASVIQNIYGQLIKGAGLTDRAFLDFAEIALFGQTYNGVLGFIAGVIAHLTFGLMFGIMFALIILKTSNNYLYIKGTGVGIAIWFWTLAVATLFNLPMFAVIPPSASVLILIGAILWGIIAAFSLKLLAPHML